MKCKIPDYCIHFLKIIHSIQFYQFLIKESEIEREREKETERETEKMFIFNTEYNLIAHTFKRKRDQLSNKKSQFTTRKEKKQVKERKENFYFSFFYTGFPPVIISYSSLFFPRTFLFHSCFLVKYKLNLCTYLVSIHKAGFFSFFFFFFFFLLSPQFLYFSLLFFS